MATAVRQEQEEAGTEIIEVAHGILRLQGVQGRRNAVMATPLRLCEFGTQESGSVSWAIRCLSSDIEMSILEKHWGFSKELSPDYLNLQVATLEALG